MAHRKPEWIFLAAWSLVAALANSAAAEPKRIVLLAEDGPPLSFVAAGGPDVILSSIPIGGSGLASYGSEDPGNTGDPIAAFAVGTTSCNIGSSTLSWNPNTADHPVIRQNIYRLKGGRFEHLGTSWVKHGFLALNENNCGGGCTQTGAPRDELRPNCSDPYSAGLNGDRTGLGPSYQINAFTGIFPIPHEAAVGFGPIRHRVQIRHSDLNPAFNPGAEYFAEGQYVHPEDAAAGNAENNVSYRKANVIPMTPQPCGPCTCIHPYCMLPDALSQTEVSDPAIRAWKTRDETVREMDARVPGEGLFILAQKTTEIGGGIWRYEYALYNMNSHRSAGAFRVPIPAGADVSDIGFHDVNYHSGELWDSTDWSHGVVDDTIVWQTTPYATNPNANALRWGTLYNFRFDIDAPPAESFVEVDLFRPGFPDAIAIRTTGPALEFIDCNDNDIDDDCDVACEVGCDPETCGQIPDCDINFIPDDCQFDCNDNGIPDFCDIRDCQPGELSCGDCDANTVPDGCDPDCDDDGEPDACEETLDTDADGFDDCEDNCPFNTPPDSCDPPEIVFCRIQNFCDYLTYSDCLSFDGVPVCGAGIPPEHLCQFGTPCPVAACRDGCRIGDYDWDGDMDFQDMSALQSCFSGEIGVPAYAPPNSICRNRFDFDDDGDVDTVDYSYLYAAIDGP